MLPLQSPLEAYRSDLSRHPNRTDFGRSDTVWLLVAHCLHRLSRAHGVARRSIAENCASAIGDLASTVSPDTPEEAVMITQLARLRGALPLIDTACGGADLIDAARILARQMGDAGALWLAFSTLGHVRVAASAARPRDIGIAMADQAWVARTLGDLDSAEELYNEVTAMGTRAHEVELVARALLGKGVTARVRGNYPSARKWLREGLKQAEAAGLADLAAIGHQGLLIAAATAGDNPTALVHGWAAFELAAEVPDRQAEILINLSQVSLLAGQARAARSGFLASMARSDSPRVHLPCMGGAAVASATVGDAATVCRLAAAAEESLSATAFPFETAGVLKSLYQAFDLVGDAARAEGYRLRARALARKNGFFEIVLATEPRESPTSTRSTATALNEESWTVIHALESLESESNASALALTLQD
jgi:tetratricopeptide (TPR) repeat protein